jgi:hypothetical protein
MIAAVEGINRLRKRPSNRNDSSTGTMNKGILLESTWVKSVYTKP